MDRNFADANVQKMMDVALLAEGVDRNILISGRVTDAAVALLAEGVDRNSQWFANTVLQPVALLAEGVDRNFTLSGLRSMLSPSPSSRRAWIEI